MGREWPHGAQALYSELELALLSGLERLPPLRLLRHPGPKCLQWQGA